MLKIDTFANAIEAQRCLNALTRIERLMLAAWRNELTEIGRRHPDIGDVTDSIIASLKDAWGDSGAHTVRDEFSDGLNRFENL